MKQQQGWRPCPNCRGTGLDFYTKVCQYCHGTGKVSIGEFFGQFPKYRGF